MSMVRSSVRSRVSVAPLTASSTVPASALATLGSRPAGRECDQKNEEERVRSMCLLGRVHRELRDVLHTEGAERRWILGADRTEELEKHNREMKRRK